jgi:hypothetical protein
MRDRELRVNIAQVRRGYRYLSSWLAGDAEGVMGKVFRIRLGSMASRHSRRDSMRVITSVVCLTRVQAMQSHRPFCSSFN